MKTWVLLLVAVVCACIMTPPRLAAQTPAEVRAAEPLRVFVDCSYYCDLDYMRTELGWISYMRDRADAQVHVLVTTEGTGGGGSRYTINFIGLKEFVGVTDTLRYTSTADETDDTRRRGLTRTIGNGLVGFAARTPFGLRLAVSAPAEGAPAGGPAGAPGAPGAPGAAPPAADPWNFWTFRIGLSGYGQGQSSSKSYRLSGNLTANRTTENWKLDTRLSGSQRENTFEYEIDGVHKKTVSTFKDYSVSTLVVKSLGPNLSAGVSARTNTSTYGNTSLGLYFAPAIEYNFVPYAESTRRQLTLRYTTGLRYADYREVTIYGETEETRPTHELELNYGTTQPWGRLYFSLSGSQYLHDRGKYNAGVGGSTEVRLFRGFSFNVGGQYALVRDQLSLPGRDLTEEEILLQQRQQATNYEYYLSAGISYRFGSIFNNVVNPRFGGSSGGGMIIMM